MRIELGELKFAVARKRQKLPVVLSFRETQQLLRCFTGRSQLQSELMYGCGLRISDCVSLRIKDFDLKSQTLNISQSKGGKSRVLMLPSSLMPGLKRQLEYSRKLHEHDSQSGGIRVSMHHALGKKAPGWSIQWEWFWLFPASDLSKDPRTGNLLRHHEGKDVYR